MLSELFYPFLAGGAERRYFEIARRLARKHDITVYSLNFQNTPSREKFEGINIIRIGSHHPLDRRSLPSLATYWPALLKSASGKYDIIDANQGAVSPYVGLFSKFSPKKFFVTFHDIYWNQFGQYFSFPLSSFGKAMEFTWSKICYSKIITVSPNTKKKLVGLGFSAPVEVIPSGIDKEFIDRIKAKRRPFTAVFVGRLEKYKHIDSLIREFAKVQNEFPDAELTIIGRGPEEERLKALAKSLGVNVSFEGFVNEKRKIELIKSSYVLINPSEVEGLGLILIESMACGTPVVAKNLDTYFFCNEKNSILFKNEGQISDSIISLFQKKGLWNSLSKEGTKTSEKFSWDETAKKVEEIYRRSL